MSRLKTALTSAIAAAIIACVPATVDALQVTKPRPSSGYVGVGTVIAASTNECFKAPDLAIWVWSDSRKCPREKDVRGAIRFAQDLFGNHDVYPVKVFYTREAFWCGDVLAQGCTLANPMTGQILVVVSSVENGWNAVMAHEWGHVAQLLSGHTGGDHDPIDLYRIAETYAGE